MASASNNQAFIDETLRVPGAKDGVLAGLTVAIKDLFDVRDKLTTSLFFMESRVKRGFVVSDIWANLAVRWLVIQQALAIPPGWQPMTHQLQMPHVSR